MKFLEETLVDFNATAASPEEAIQKAGQLLLQSGAIQSSYIDAMIASYHENGPYFVLAPQLAIPHARPEDGANEAALSMIKLQKPLAFGHSVNDPVQLVFALGAASSEEHLALLQRLTRILNKKENMEQLLSLKTYEELEKLLGGLNQ
ncbi:PTS sugar transporter subunit IIA [Camelliibacillus cellulosilyticus]|uniref:PTS sugar transporter subunit IIA n=1 Tax=Camelliibacillus cellulosilyticus TaxID=2174486 RepID=A0ABV9GPG4_9BACL